MCVLVCVGVCVCVCACTCNGHKARSMGSYLHTCNYTVQTMPARRGIAARLRLQSINMKQFDPHSLNNCDVWERMEWSKMHAYQWDSKLGHKYMGPYLPDTRHEYVVDSSQFHVDLEAEVGEGLW